MKRRWNAGRIAALRWRTGPSWRMHLQGTGLSANPPSPGRRAMHLAVDEELKAIWPDSILGWTVWKAGGGASSARLWEDYGKEVQPRLFARLHGRKLRHRIHRIRLADLQVLANHVGIAKQVTQAHTRRSPVAPWDYSGW